MKINASPDDSLVPVLPRHARNISFSSTCTAAQDCILNCPIVDLTLISQLIADCLCNISVRAQQSHHRQRYSSGSTSGLVPLQEFRCGPVSTSSETHSGVCAMLSRCSCSFISSSVPSSFSSFTAPLHLVREVSHCFLPRQIAYFPSATWLVRISRRLPSSTKYICAVAVSPDDPPSQSDGPTVAWDCFASFAVTL